MDDYYDLGSYSCPITTKSADAQLWFDRGLIWTYAYNHGEATVCFQRALDHDPDCAMAHWGIAYATGPNYNMPWDLYDDAGRAKAIGAAYDATRAALALVDGVTDVEAALIRALPARYPQLELAEDMHAWDYDFADAMRAAFAAHPDHLDLRTV